MANIKKLTATIEDIDHKKNFSTTIWIFLEQRKQDDKLRVEVSVLKQRDEHLPEFVGTCVLKSSSYGKLQKAYNLPGKFEDFSSFVDRILTRMQDPRKSFLHCRVFDDQIQILFGVVGEGNLMIDAKRGQTDVIEFLANKISRAPNAVEEVEKSRTVDQPLQKEKSAEKAAQNAPTIPMKTVEETKSPKIETSPASIKAPKHGTSQVATKWDQGAKEKKHIKPEDTKDAVADTGSVVKPSKDAPKVEKHESKTSAKTTKEDASKISTKTVPEIESPTRVPKFELQSGWELDEEDEKKKKAHRDSLPKSTNNPVPVRQEARGYGGARQEARGYGGVRQEARGYGGGGYGGARPYTNRNAY